MRRRLILLAGAVSLMVALAFVIPLGFLVGDLASDRALSAGERKAQEIARVIATVAQDRGLVVAAAAVDIESDGDLPTSIILPDGTVLGAPLLPEDRIEVALGGAAFRTPVTGGEVIYTPIVQPDGAAVVVRVLVPTQRIEQGVTRSWLVLGAIGTVLVLMGLLAADLLGRSIVEPVKELAGTAERLGEGDLKARVQPAGPREIHDVALVFNRLAERVGRLIQQERDNAADMSHRLRTPLTALRLNAEAIADDDTRHKIMDDIDTLERTVDFLISHATTELDGSDERTDLTQVVAERVAFWAPLAEEQSRDVSVTVTDGPVVVAMSEHNAEAIIDILFDNVFAHVPDGIPMAIHLDTTADVAHLVVEDGGSGMADASVVQRGISLGASTGLGLDIVRRTAEASGGRLRLESSPFLGGARVVVELPVVDARHGSAVTAER